MIIYCCACKSGVNARLTNGVEIYPHRPSLKAIPMWICDKCKNYVGCHHKSNDKTKPLGCIPTPVIRKARKEIHRVLDPLWQGDKEKRKQIYASISETLGYEYHTAEIKCLTEAMRIHQFVLQMRILTAGDTDA
jgi:hypothetical protein